MFGFARIVQTSLFSFLILFLYDPSPRKISLPKVRYAMVFRSFWNSILRVNTANINKGRVWGASRDIWWVFWKSFPYTIPTKNVEKQEPTKKLRTNKNTYVLIIVSCASLCRLPYVFNMYQSHTEKQWCNSVLCAEHCLPDLPGQVGGFNSGKRVNTWDNRYLLLLNGPPKKGKIGK